MVTFFFKFLKRKICEFIIRRMRGLNKLRYLNYIRDKRNLNKKIEKFNTNFVTKFIYIYKKRKKYMIVERDKEKG